MREQFGPTACGGVPCGHFRYRQRPVDGKVGVFVDDAEVFVRVVGPVDSVADICAWGEGLKPVQKTRRHVQVSEVFIVEPKCLLPAESRGSSSDVDENIVHGAVGTANKFCLAPSRTAVHASDHALRGTGLRVLNERRRRSCGADIRVEYVGVERAREQTAVVAERLGDKDQHVSKVRLLDVHGEMLP